MTRFFLSLILVILTTLVGYSFSLRLHNRKEVLLSLVESFEKMKNLISFSGYDIDRVILLSFSGVPGFDFDSSESSAKSLSERWEESVKSFIREAKLRTCDEEVLLRFGERLGVTDTEGQLNNCELYIGLLKELHISAKEEVENKSKLLRVMGFSSGALIALLIL